MRLIYIPNSSLHTKPYKWKQIRKYWYKDKEAAIQMIKFLYYQMHGVEL